ncbi:MAG: hypothetical protein ACI822_003222 [Gammaproteobacteria bacterium]
MSSPAALVIGCGSSGEATNSNPNENLSLQLQLPDSLTGGDTARNRQVANRIAALASSGRSGEPCSYLGPENEDDLFRNGYETTRFMISIMAIWTCIADLMIDLSDFIEARGVIVESDNDKASADYDIDDPTHYSITDNSATQVTVRMYYSYDRSNPPAFSDSPEFYISWNKVSEDDISGKMVIDASAIDASSQDSDDPAMMRMDFNFGAAERNADMFLQFDNGNPWAEGFRIKIVKDENASPLGQVFTARGLFKMTSQWLPVAGISEVPHIQFFTVSDLLGNGAAIEEVQDFALPLVINIFQGNRLGNYLFSKRDIYFFEDDQDWEYIHKSVIASEFRGARTTIASGGSWVPFDPSQDMIISALSRDADYFTGPKCAVLNDDCNALLNGIFVDGFAGQGQNQGSDPMDWRSAALDNADFLTSIYPNGVNWDGAFDQQFMP